MLDGNEAAAVEAIFEELPGLKKTGRTPVWPLVQNPPLSVFGGFLICLSLSVNVFISLFFLEATKLQREKRGVMIEALSYSPVTWAAWLL